MRAARWGRLARRCGIQVQMQGGRHLERDAATPAPAPGCPELAALLNSTCDVVNSTSRARPPHRGDAQAQGTGGQPRRHRRGGHRRVRGARLQGRQHGRHRRPHQHHARAHQLLLRQQGEAVHRRARAGVRRDPRGRGQARPRPPAAGGRGAAHRRVHLRLLHSPRGLRAPRGGGKPGARPPPAQVEDDAHAQPADHRPPGAGHRARPGGGPLPHRRRPGRGAQGHRRARHVQHHEPVHLRQHLPARNGREGGRGPAGAKW